MLWVAETPISKEMTNEMVLHYQLQDKTKQQKEKTDKDKKRKEWLKTLPNKINAHIKKYEAIYKYIVFGGVGIGIIQLIIKSID